MKRIFITGATGYFGKILTNKLSKDGYQITCAVRPGTDYSELKKISSDIKFVSFDLKLIEENFQSESYDWLINLAAKYEKSGTSTIDIITSNTILGIELLELACRYKISNFLSIDTSLPDYFNLYSFTKKRVADFGKFMAQKGKINFINIQLEMFYGFDEPKDRFIPMCIDKLKKEEDLQLTVGTQIRDIIHVYDVINIFERIMEIGLKGYYDIPVGTGARISIRELIEYMKEVTASRSNLLFGAIESRPNEPSCVADVNVLYSIIGRYDFIYNWKNGIQAIICEDKSEKYE